MKEYLEKMLLIAICAIFAIAIITISVYFRSVAIMFIAVMIMIVAIIAMTVSMIVSVCKNDDGNLPPLS